MLGIQSIAQQDPIYVSAQAISRLNAVGERDNFPWLNIVDEMRVALSNMPDGKVGVVIGSGGNTMDWKERGWRTLDIDPSSGADLIYDANWLGAIVFPNSVDYLYAECLTIDPDGVAGVSPARLLNQANRILKQGGILGVKTVSMENPDEGTTIPHRQKFGKAFANHGFNVVVQLHEYFPHPSTPNPDGFAEQRVVYYGRKVAEGYSER